MGANLPTTASAQRNDLAGGPHFSREPLRYRPDIDGLRAVAILPILLLHCGLTFVKGGFVGVDVFFVISGYLITEIITREIAQGHFSLLGFYQRRAVRILPALGLMIAATLVAGCWLLLPISLQDLGKSAAASSLFGSNIYFYLTSGYFAQKAELQPLIHTWSLAVEEQFYLFYPLLLLALRSAERRVLIRTLGAIAIASFLIGGWFAARDPNGGYFLLPSRAWELMLGALVALRCYPRIESARWRSTLCVFALVTILVCAIRIGATWPFPVPFALPPVIGAAVLLAYLPGTAPARLLETRPLRAIGRLSYSLYLWHRPIIAFYMIDRPATLSFTDSAILLTMSFTAATLSYWLVERPALRRWRGVRDLSVPSGSPIRLVATAFAGIACFAVAGVVIAGAAWQIVALPPAVVKVAAYQGFDSTPAGRAQFDLDHCFVIPTGRAYDPTCLVPATDRPNVMLVGDSHAGQLSLALRQAMPGAHLVQATAAGCRPLLEGPGLPGCRAIVNAAYHKVDLRKIGTVVLAGRWYIEDMPALVKTIGYLRARGSRVVVVGPVVEYDADVPDALARAMLNNDLSHLETLRIADRAPLDVRMRQLIPSTGARYVSWFAIECPNGRCRRFSVTGGPLHMDRTHVTPELAAEMAASIATQAGFR